jgi:hypothetical protein
MTERRYNIHGLAEVVIAPGVRPEIVREIDFQIGSLRIQSQGNVTGGPCVHVRPYTEYKNNEVTGGATEAVFYHCNGAVGTCLTDEAARLCVHRGSNGFTIFADYSNFLINLYLQLLLVPQGYSMVHAAAYKDKVGKVTILAGAGGIGKTAVLGYAVREKGLQHLGDDVVILGSKGECLAFPRAFVLKSYHREGYAETFQRLNLPRWNLYSVKRFLIENAPFVGLTKGLLRKSGLYYKVADLIRPQPFLATISPDQLFGQGSMAKSGEIGRIAYLDRVYSAEFAITALTIDTCVNRLFAVIHHEWKDFLVHLISLGALDVVNLPSYCEKVADTLRLSVAAKELVHVQVPVDASPEQLVRFLESKGFF